MTKWIRIGVLAAFVAALAAAPLAAYHQKPPQTVRYGSKVQAGAGARRGRGRPRKFNRPSRAVTLTLPEDVVAVLYALDADLSRAVVRAAQPFVADAPRPPAELTTFGSRAVIVVPRNAELKDRAGLELIPLSDGRALISFDEGVSISEIELRLQDALADPAFPSDDRIVFEALADILSTARRDERVSVRRRSIIVLHGMQHVAEQVDVALAPQPAPASV